MQNKTAEDLSKLEDLNSLSKRLKYVIEMHGIKQSHLANKLGISPSGLHYILNQDDIPSKNTEKNVEKIADLLKVNPKWLKTGSGQIYSLEEKPNFQMIPVYYPDQIKLYFQKKDSSILQTQHECHVIGNYQGELFGLFVTDTALSPKFELGDRLILEKTNAFKNGEIVLAYLADSQNLVLRIAMQNESDIFLTDFTQTKRQLNSNQGDFIVGRYLECHKVAPLIGD